MGRSGFRRKAGKHRRTAGIRRANRGTEPWNPRLQNQHISAYNRLVRRKPGALVPLEYAICETAAGLHHSGIEEFHGYELAKRLGDIADQRLLTAYGTLYRALGRMEQMGLLKSRWEDPAIPARENRPGRRLYSLTAAGESAAREAAAADASTARRVRRRLASV
jgi:PadR family transcriptional regulator PadR